MASKQGKKSDPAKRFDSNCITPGTPFMARLNEHLKYFVNSNISANPDWQGVRVVLSGHDVCTLACHVWCSAGAGAWRGRAQDHGLYPQRKVASRLRLVHPPLHVRPRRRPGTRLSVLCSISHVRIWQMVLGLASHEPYFFLLREEVKFGRQVEDT